MGGALRKDFDKGIASSLGLDAQGFFDGLPGLDPMLGIVERSAQLEFVAFWFTRLPDFFP